MKKFLLILILFIQITGVKSQYLIGGYHLVTIPKDNLNHIPGMDPEYDVHAYYIQYHTLNGSGDSTLASGLCLIPATDTCNFFPLISYQHGTTLRRCDVPSRLNQESLIGQIFASLGNITLLPDYVGLGDSPGLHPYCHGLTEATATIDLIRAAREFMSDSLGIFDNGQIFLTGYSQGGHATMAAHKYIEENNLMNEMNVVASAPCSGPYHISGAQAEMIFQTPDYPSPAYLVYILFAYNSVYQNIFDGTNEIFQSPYDVIIPAYMDGNSYTWELNNALPDSLHQFLQPVFYQEVIDYMIDKTTPFWQNLLDNDNHEWAPVAPVRLYYCQADEQVSYLNSVNALNAMQLAGATDVQAMNVNPVANHGDCGIPAIVNAYYWFNTMRIPCSSMSSFDESEMTDIGLFPNPASEILTITGFRSGMVVRLFDAGGKPEGFRIVSAINHAYIDISHLKNGMYFIRVTDQRGVFEPMVRKFMVIK
jgi:hypothetical protein